jgi:hypothetical protein
MSGPEISEILGHVTTWKKASPWQRGAFVQQMAGCQYGRDALTQAWAWFLAGWEECKAFY